MSSDGAASEKLQALIEAKAALAQAEEEFFKVQAQKLYEGLTKVHDLYRGNEPRFAVWLHGVGQSGCAIQMLRTDEVLMVIEETTKHVRSHGANGLINALNKLFMDHKMGVKSDQTLTEFTLGFHSYYY